jgi:membrane protease YdiL (CAAX protease family)
MRRALRYPGFWLAVGLSLLVVVMQGVLGAGLQVLGLLLAHASGRTLNLAGDPFVLGCVNLVAISAVITLGLLINRQPLRSAFPLGPIAGGAWLALPLVVLGAGILLSEVDNAFRWFCPPPDFVVQLMSNTVLAEGRGFSQFFTLVIVAPLTEELLCRGLILRGLLSRYRPWAAVVMSAILFALMHVNPWQTLSALVLGLIFGWFYLRTGSLWPGIVGHALHNGIVTLIVVAPFGLWEPPSAADMRQVHFQPWFLDAVGLMLLLLGLWFFRRASAVSLQDVRSELPPILPAPDLPPTPPGQSV